MSITIRNMYQHAPQHYGMQLLAGGAGLDHLASWVHIIEDINAAPLLRGQEAVITSCALARGEDWLLEFAKRLIKADASAFMVTLSPAVPVVPEQVVTFCEKMKLPLFTLPESVCSSDVSRDFCQMIVDDQNAENTASSAMKNLLRGVGNREEQLQKLEQMGIHRDSAFTFVSAKSIRDDSDEKKIKNEDRILMIGEKIGKSLNDVFLHFRFEDRLIFVLIDYTEAQINHFTDIFMKTLDAYRLLTELHMGISGTVSGISKQDSNFDCACEACDLAIRKNQHFLRYEDMGAYKLLIDVKDKSVLRSYYNDTLGKLEAYDQEHSTEFSHFLKVYLECSASPQKVSEKMYIHRNTVSNYLKKVETITGSNLDSLEEKVKAYIAYYIADLI